MIDNTKMEAGDVVIALPSTGIHSNGFSLCRKVFDIDNNNPELYVSRDELGGKNGCTDASYPDENLCKAGSCAS